MIPLCDLTRQHAPLGEDYLNAIRGVIESGAFCGGPQVARFEEAFAGYCQTRQAVGVGSGTEALWLCLRAMGIGGGDEVLTVPMTFAATVEAICQTGARPVLVDIDERSYTLSPAALERAITPRAKAVIPVHLFGHPADMNPLLEIARARGLRVVEDCAQAHGAQYHGRKAGGLGDAGCFSFYPGKNLGAFGEGGAVVTGDDELVHRLRVLANHGQSRKNQHVMIGWNSRLDAIQAAVLHVKLHHLDEANHRRREHARHYDALLSKVQGVTIPRVMPGHLHVYHQYVIRVEKRRRLLQRLDDAGIGYGVHYPVPVHLQPAYRWLGYQAGDFPVAEACARSFVSLPVYPELSAGEIQRVTDVVATALGAAVAA